MLAPAESYKPGKKHQKSFRIIPVLILSIVAGFGLDRLVRHFVTMPVRIAGDSGGSAFPEGSTIHMSRWFDPGGIKTGDLILATHPGDPDKTLLLQAIGCGGGSVEIQGGEVFLDGKKVTPADWQKKGDLFPAHFSNRDEAESVPIKPETCYALSLNREGGPDSRNLGPIAFPSIQAIKVSKP